VRSAGAAQADTASAGSRVAVAAWASAADINLQAIFFFLNIYHSPTHPEKRKRPEKTVSCSMFANSLLITHLYFYKQFLCIINI